MAARFLIVPEALNDIQEAYAWYESRRAGLGEELLTSINACIQATCRSPEIHAKVRKNYRRAMVRRFPYALFYEFLDDVVTVYGVVHTSQNPNKWRGRLP